MKFDTIKALLNLARENQNDNEAQAAFAKAVALAAKAGIDIAVIEAQMGEPHKREEFINSEIQVGGRIPVVQKFVSFLINDCFDVNIVYSGGRYGRSVTFLGRKSDVEFAVYANEFLAKEFVRRWEYYRASRNLALNAKNAYLYGMYEGYRDRVRQEKAGQRHEAVAAHDDTTKQKFAMVLVDEKKQRQDFVARKFSRLKPATTRINGLHSDEVRGDGRAAGATIRVNLPLD